MFNSGILDVVIGVVVIYLQLSLVCTAINELVALWFQKRAKELEKGIRGLLTSKELGDKFFEHPLIKGLRPDERKPSYIPARTFSLALMDIVRRGAFDGNAAKAAANQAVSDKETAVAATEAALATANSALVYAKQISEAADASVAAASAADKTTALQAAQEAKSKEAAAQAQVVAAQAPLDAANQAKSDADKYLDQVTKDVQAVEDAEKDAKTAENALAANPKNKDLKAKAESARKKVDDAKDKLAPSAAGLLTEARDKVASSQSNVLPPQLKVALLALMDNAGTSLTKAQANVEQWFDDAMDRVSGTYKRNSHIFVVVLAVLVTIFANVDTLQVASTLQHDKAVRDSLVAAAPELAKKGELAPTPAPTTPPPAGTPPAGGAAGGSGANSSATPAPTATPPTIANIKESLDKLDQLGLPIGYIQVCTKGEEIELESCATATDAIKRESDSGANETKAAAALVTANKALETAQNNDKAATTNDKAATQQALSKAQDEQKKAQTAHDNAAAEVSKASAARVKALKARTATDKQLETDLATAETEATANPDDQAKQKAVKEERLKVASAGCPTCSKYKELTPDQLTRRFPSTHGNGLRSSDGRWALAKDIGSLLYNHWLGWLLTAMAISLGAPFWFDMLNKLIVVRSTVKPHEKSKEQESKDNPSEKDATDKT